MSALQWSNGWICLILNHPPYETRLTDRSQLNYMRHQVEIPRLVELDVGRYQAGITLRPVVNPGMMGGRSVRMEGGRVGAGESNHCW